MLAYPVALGSLSSQSPCRRAISLRKWELCWVLLRVIWANTGSEGPQGGGDGHHAHLCLPQSSDGAADTGVSKHWPLGAQGPQPQDHIAGGQSWDPHYPHYFHPIPWGGNTYYTPHPR